MEPTTDELIAELAAVQKQIEAVEAKVAVEEAETERLKGAIKVAEKKIHITDEDFLNIARQLLTVGSSADDKNSITVSLFAARSTNATCSQ